MLQIFKTCNSYKNRKIVDESLFFSFSVIGLKILFNSLKSFIY